MSHSECVITVLLSANQHYLQCVHSNTWTHIYVLHTEFPPRYLGSSKGILENSSQVSQVQHFVAAGTFLGDNNHYNTTLLFPAQSHS